MKGPAASVGILLLALGALLIWSGFQGVSLLAVIQGILSGKGLTTSTTSSGGTLGKALGETTGDLVTTGADIATGTSGGRGVTDPVPTLADSLNTNTVTQIGATR